MWINFNDAANNAIVGPGWAHVVGPRWHWSSHGAARVCYVPGSFMQSNAGAYDALLASLRDAVPPGSAVSELYAGAGAIGLSIAASDASVESVRCVESVAAAAETFAASASELPDAARTATTFVVARAEDAARDAVRDADVIIVDPPRKGLDARTLAALTGASPDATSTDPTVKKNRGADPRAGMQGHAGGGRKKRNRRRRRAAKGGGENASASARAVEAIPPPPARLRTLVYVSCGFASFERDAEALLESGEWTLERAEGFNPPGGTRWRCSPCSGGRETKCWWDSGESGERGESGARGERGESGESGASGERGERRERSASRFIRENDGSRRGVRRRLSVRRARRLYVCFAMRVC